MQPAKRQGALWDAFRGLQATGWVCDGSNYATAFRVAAANGKDLSTLQVGRAGVGLLQTGWICQ